jgi:general secretion pathway protein B
MSLILDALKKSEAERQRQSGPTLLEVRVTQPRRRYPVWVIAVGALLAVNILLLLIFVLRRPAAPEPAAAPAAGSAAAAGSTAATLPVTAATPAQAVTPASASATGAGAMPASVAPMVSPMVPAAAELPLAPARGVSRDTALETAPADGVADGPIYGSTAGRNPADDEPAVAASDAGHYASLPSFSDVGGDLPALRLDLHVYAERPRDRYALINMHRVHEGDVLPEGARVLAITREGVALDWHGQEFMLHPQ